ncbi:hypothetical protein BAE44_0024167 [Dichanthelium oligosanthes]|uniref:Uncharacterized protein n=1 Tax=Dichanthelium oligosanthes TaxID=888268 RepID=A0A1E5UPN2_9POAL|nr:hypothetical protein BAE44_0024167 [Dichanthelium oligosanthes]
MHDLVHELARSVAVDEVAISDANRQGSSSPKMENYRYMLFSNFIGWTPESSDMPSKARAIHFKDCTGCKPSMNTFAETKWLRVLDFSGMQTVKLPKSMKKLHHLQVLNLSGNTSLEKLRGSICNLQKVHYLDLRGCSNLKELPEAVHKLKDLVHLDLSGCTSLQKLPSQFGKLLKLSFLSLSCCSKLETLPDSFSQLRNLEHLNLSFCSRLKQLNNVSFKRMKGLLYVSMSSCTSLEVLPEFCGDNNGCLKLEILDLSYCDQLNTLPESCAGLHKLRFLNLSGCSHIQNILFFLSKFTKLEYLNLSGVLMEKGLPGVDMKRDSEAPGPSAGHCSNYSSEELSPRKLHEILKNMYHLEYFSVGGVSLFSEQGISRDLLTLPDFVVSKRGSGDCSNITLLQYILDSTHYELNIRCLEIVKFTEEVKKVELGKRHQLGSLSLEWSSSEWYTPSEPTVKAMDVLENLKPHQSLEHLTIKGYNHSIFPRWFVEISNTLPNLVKLVLSDLVCCDHLPILGNLPKLEELEIRNIPRLKEAYLAPCKNLKRLSLIDLASGCTLGFCRNGWASIRAKRNCEEIHDLESGLAEELESHVVSKKQSGGPSQGNKETVLGGIKSKGPTSDVPVSSPALTASKEAFPLLCYLKIKYCKHLRLYPSILKCEEYFINESNLEFITETWSSTSILACKMHIKSCSYDNVKLLQFLDVNIGELIIDGCSNDKEESGGEGEDVKIMGKESDRIEKKFGKQTIQKIKITNYENYDLQNLPFIPSLRDLEIDCVKRIDSFSPLTRLACLEKLTLSSPENFLHIDKVKIINAIPRIQCIKINKAMYFSPQESDFLILGQNRDFGITELFITNLENVKNTNDDSPGELARYNQVRRLSLLWPKNARSILIQRLLRAKDFPNEAYSILSQGSDDWLKEARSILSQGLLGSDDWSNDARSSFSQGLSRADDSAVLCRLQPHPTNLSTLRIEGYRDVTFCAWMSNPNNYLPNLVKVELIGMPRCNRLPSLGQLAILEELHISHMPNIREVDSSFYGGRHPFRKLRELRINNMVNLEVWSTNLEPSAAQMSCDVEQLEEEIFPCLQNLIVESCPRLTPGSAFQGCIRRIVDLCSKLAISSEKLVACSPAGSVLELEAKIYGFSNTLKLIQYLGIKGDPRLMLGSAFLDCIRRIVGSCSEAEISSGMFVGSLSGLSRLEVETNIFGLSDGSELLQYSVNLSNLTIKSVSDLITLTEVIRNCHSLRSLQILECWNFSAIPDWLGDLASLEEIEVHAPKLQCLPQAIKGMTSLKKLILKKCNYKLRERCSSSGQDYDKIKHIKHVDTNEVITLFQSFGPDFSASSSSDITLLQKITSPQLIELNINCLERLSTSEAKKIKLAEKEELCSLSLDWSSYDRRSSSELDKTVLEELRPHLNLKRLCIKNYIGSGFPNWMASLPNLVRLELFNVLAGCLHLDGLQNLEDLCISSFYWRGTHLLPMHMDPRYGTSPKHIVSTQTLKNLKRVTIAGVGNLVWETSTSCCIEQNHDNNMEISQRPMERTRNSIDSQSYCWPTKCIYPALEYLEIDSCSDLKFEPSLPRSARYVISGSKQYRRLFELPSFKQIMGLSASASSSKMEIKYSSDLSFRSFDSLRQLDVDELTVDSCNDSIPLPECIQSWKSLRKVEILNCENIETLPEWLGHMASLHELKVETYWMKILPPCIKKLTSLQTLTLSKCTKRFKQRCSKEGDDWSKIKHIENVQIELRP